MSKEAKKREVIQLLKDYRSFHTPFGGAMPTDEGHLRSAGYGSGGYVESGSEFSEGDRKRLRESMDALGIALHFLRKENFGEWLGLHGPYLMDGADPALVEEWRRKAKGKYAFVPKRQIERHEAAIDALAVMLASVDLYVVFPKRSNSRDVESIEKRNDEAYEAYLRCRREMGKTKAVREAARFSDYSEDRIWKILAVREPKDAKRAC